VRLRRRRRSHEHFWSCGLPCWCLPSPVLPTHRSTGHPSSSKPGGPQDLICFQRRANEPYTRPRASQREGSPGTDASNGVEILPHGAKPSGGCDWKQFQPSCTANSWCSKGQVIVLESTEGCSSSPKRRGMETIHGKGSLTITSHLTTGSFFRGLSVYGGNL